MRRQCAIERLHRKRECANEQLHAQRATAVSIEPKLEVACEQRTQLESVLGRLRRANEEIAAQLDSILYSA